TSPTPPAATCSRMVAYSGKKRTTWAGYSLTPARSHSAMTAVASATSRASGFSQMTSQPAAAAARITSAWVWLGVHTSTMSAPSSASSRLSAMISGSSVRRTSGLYSAENTRRRAPSSCQAGRCTWAMLPTPITATVGALVIQPPDDVDSPRGCHRRGEPGAGGRSRSLQVDVEVDGEGVGPWQPRAVDRPAGQRVHAAGPGPKFGGDPLAQRRELLERRIGETTRHCLVLDRAPNDGQVVAVLRSE